MHLLFKPHPKAMSQLPSTFTDESHTFTQVARKGLHAVYLRSNGLKRSWETIRIIQDPIAGTESYPEHWRFGLDGFCFGCETRALRKLKQLTNSR